jgi:hypothetical protein
MDVLEEFCVWIRVRGELAVSNKNLGGAVLLGLFEVSLEHLVKEFREEQQGQKG